MRLVASRFTVRSMTVVVAGVGLLLGGSIEFMRLKRLSRVYAAREINARRNLGYSKRFTERSHEEWLTACRKFDEFNRKQSWFKMPRPISPEVARERVAYWKPLVSKYEHAAYCPWLAVDPDPPRPK